MATEFSLLLRGNDPEHLDAVAVAALEEIERVERLLSRYHPAAEVTRINRSPAGVPIPIEWELASILSACQAWHRATQGYFDVGYHQQFDLPPNSNRLVKRANSAALDFGGFGKGYALDSARAIVQQFGVEHALLSGGGSSWLALGSQSEGVPWRVRVDATSEQRTFPMPSGALSISQTSHAGEVSDVVDPTTGRPIEHQARCMVAAASAAAAEVWSTALLARGPAHAAAMLNGPGNVYPFEVYWSE